MPTGYTYELMEKGMDFKTFALRCARNFGALVMMRDAPSDAPIPDKFEPSDYYAKSLAEAQEKNKQLKGMTDNEKITFGEKEKAALVTRLREALMKEEEGNRRLSEMETQVNSWKPPTPDHEGLKRFMLEQIQISVNDIFWVQQRISEAEGKIPMAYYVEALSRTAWDIYYYTEENSKEIERTKSRNQWIKDLCLSL